LWLYLPAGFRGSSSLQLRRSAWSTKVRLQVPNGPRHRTSTRSLIVSANCRCPLRSPRHRATPQLIDHQPLAFRQKDPSALKIHPAVSNRRCLSTVTMQLLCPHEHTTCETPCTHLIRHRLRPSNRSAGVGIASTSPSMLAPNCNPGHHERHAPLWPLVVVQSGRIAVVLSRGLFRTKRHVLDSPPHPSAYSRKPKAGELSSKRPMGPSFE